jgi:pyridoxamine 5'-phosphate oxidase
MILPEYTLSESNVSRNPFEQFGIWYSDHIDTDPEENGVVMLATSGSDGTVSARTVLMKEYDETGFVFYTNYESRKAGQLRENPHAALLFYWPELFRQVRIEGTVEKVSSSMSDAYFKSRPRSKRIASIASHQSSILTGKKALLNKVSFIRNNNIGKALPRPDYWGGYRLIPVWFEFWLAGKNRLHDRISYTLAEGKWIIDRLSP